MWAALHRCGRLFERAATLGFYAAAGAARLADLTSSIEREWDRSGAEEWEGYVASGLMPWERDFYPRFLRAGDRVLVIGCGTGRDLLAFLEHGYRAEGVDVGPGCTAAARRLLGKRGFEAPIYTGAIETLALPGRYDAFVFSWFCYSYIPQSARRVHVLRTLAEHLTPGGRILVTYVPARTPPRHLPIRLARLVGWLVRSDWRPEPGDVLQVAERGRGFLHYEHRFGPGEIEDEGRAAGLTVTFHEAADEGTAVLVAGQARR